MAGIDLKTPPKVGDKSEPHMRLLLCETCRVIDEIPDFDGYPEDDIVLQLTIEKHPNHKGRMYKVPLKYLMVPVIKENIVKQIMSGITKGLDVLDSTFYDTRNTFAEDAMRCFAQHGRPQGQCPDFNSKKKRLVPKTQAERKDAGLDMKSAPVIHLCSFCPVRMFNEMKHNEESGLSK